MSDFSLTQQKGIPLKNNQPKSSNALLEAVGGMYDKTFPVTNIVKKSATSAEVAQNAAADKASAPTATATTDGSNTDLSFGDTGALAAGVGGAMNVKTNGGDEKKYQLGFALSGYKSIIQKNGNQQNTMPGMGASVADDDIKWLVSMYNVYENGKDGFNQATVVTNSKTGETDNAGITVTAWSLTQKHNFDKLAKYMREEGMDSGLCDLVAAGHNKTSDITINGKSLYAEMKRILSTSNKGTEEYKKMVRASTKIYRDNWWEAILWGIYNSGVKTKLGMGLIARWMGLTGGFKNLCQKSLRAGLFYTSVSNVDEVSKLEPAVAGADKEKDWIISYSQNHSKKWDAWANCSNDFINAANTGNLDSPEFNAASQGVVIRYGEIISGLASEEQDIIEILKTANGPEVLGSGVGMDGIADVPLLNNVPQWPSESQVLSGTSVFGRLKDAPDVRYGGTTKIPVVPMVKAYCPYPLYTGGGGKTQYVECHPVVKPHLEAIFREILQKYGQENIHKLKMDIFDGSFVPRKRGKGTEKKPSKPSMHSIGIAFDWNSETNGLHTKAPAATNSAKEWASFWHIWENHGARSLR